LIDKTGSFDLGFALAGCMPMFAFIFIAALWEPRRKRPEGDPI